jgi:hypothetical protein
MICDNYSKGDTLLVINNVPVISVHSVEKVI